MRAIACTAPGLLSLTNPPTPRAERDEVLVRIRRVGVCGTDFHIFKGDQPFVTYPRIMGHELAGEVASESTAFAIGDRVCVLPYMSCEACVACRRGKTNCCANIAVLGVHKDGGLAEYLSVPERFLIKGDGLSLDALAMVEFLAIGRHAVRRANVTEGQRVLIVGAGPIGLGAALFAQIAGAAVTAIDTRPDRLAFCRSVLNLPYALTPDDAAKGALSDITHGEHFDVVFDATGNRAAMESGFRYVAHGGAYVLISIVQGDISFNDSEFHKRETTLLASRNATRDDFIDVIEAMRDARVPIAALNTHRSTLEDLPERLPEWMSPEAGVIKAIVEL